MSSCDLLVSSWFFLTSWPIPREADDIYGNMGNRVSCIAQVFFSQFSIAVIMYNASLSLFYLIKIRNGWSDKRIARRLESFMHAWALLFGIGTSTTTFGSAGFLPFDPLDCHESWKNGDGKTTCIRGNSASLYRWVFYYAPLWCTIAFVTIIIYLVYRHVRRVERQSERYGESQYYAQQQQQHARRRRQKYSQRVANQGFWYCGAFYATWFFPTVTRLVQVITGGAPYPLVIITAIFVPIQGFFNFIVYVHPRYKSLRMTMGRTSTTTNSERWSSAVWSSIKLGSRFFHRQPENRSLAADETADTKMGPDSTLSKHDGMQNESVIQQSVHHNSGTEGFDCREPSRVVALEREAEAEMTNDGERDVKSSGGG